MAMAAWRLLQHQAAQELAQQENDGHLCLGWQGRPCLASAETQDIRQESINVSPPADLPLRVHPGAGRSLGPFPQGPDCLSMGLPVAASGEVPPMRSPSSK